MKEFIKNFADQFDDTDISEFTPDTRFRDLEEWSSLTGIAVINMAKRKYNKQISVQDLRNTQTIKDLYDIIAGN